MKTSFIGFAGADWWYHNRSHSDFQLLKRMARGHKVLLINSIGMRMPTPAKTSRSLYKIWRKLKSVARGIRRPVRSLPNFYVFSPLSIPLYSSALMRRWTAWFIRKQVQVAARLVGVANPVIFITTPTAWPVAATMKRQAIVYNRSDMHSLFKEADQAYIRTLERALLEHADLVLYANRTLMAEEQEWTQVRARYLDHGVDVEHFRLDKSVSPPQDLADVPGPWIGFFGSLRSYMVDFSLLARVANEIPTAQVVLIGDPQDSVSQLAEIPNVHLLGYKDYSQIPSYGVHFDVALMPYQDNEWIRYCNPIKLKEYLALGLQVVATDFPEAHGYAERLHIARDSDDFVRLVRDCLKAPLTYEQRNKLRKTVENHTWDQRASELLSLLGVEVNTSMNEGGRD